MSKNYRIEMLIKNGLNPSEFTYIKTNASDIVYERKTDRKKLYIRY